MCEDASLPPEGSKDATIDNFGMPLAAAGVSAAVAGMGLLGWFSAPWNLIVALVIRVPICR